MEPIIEENTDHQPEEKKSPSKKQKISVIHILGGDILKEDYIVKQLKLLILIVFLFVLYISNRYSCLKKISEIEDLKRQYTELSHENLVISTELARRSRQSQIEELLRKKGIQVSTQKTPAYKIKK